MKPYDKNTMKGWKPAIEIYHKGFNKWMFHNSGVTDFKLFTHLMGYMLRYISQVLTNQQPAIYDTAKPEDRKRLNKKK